MRIRRLLALLLAVLTVLPAWGAAPVRVTPNQAMPPCATPPSPPVGTTCYDSSTGQIYVGGPGGATPIGSGGTGAGILPICAIPRTNTTLGACCYEANEQVQYCGDGLGGTVRQGSPSQAGPLPPCTEPVSNVTVGECCWAVPESKQYCGNGTVPVAVGPGPSGLVPACSSPPTNLALGDCCQHLTENVLYCGTGAATAVMGPAASCTTTPPTAANLPQGRICATTQTPPVLWVGTATDPVQVISSAGAPGATGDVPYRDATGALAASQCKYVAGVGMRCTEGYEAPCDPATQTCVNVADNETTEVTDPVDATTVNWGWVNGVFTFYPGGGALQKGTTASNTQTLTGKTLDAEGTGNIITLVSKVILETASCLGGAAALDWDDSAIAETKPTAACNDTGSIQRPSADYSGSAVNCMERTFRLPSDWVGAIDAVLSHVAVAASPTGNVEWDLYTVCRAVGESWNGSFNTVQTITDATVAQNLLNDATQTGVTTTGCAAGEYFTFKICRDGTNDSNNDLAKLLLVELTLRRAQ